MDLGWIAAAYNRTFGKQRRRNSSGTDTSQLKIQKSGACETSRVFIIGSSIIARWKNCKLNATLIGVEGIDTFDLKASMNHFVESLNSDDTLMCYCGSNDFLRGRNIQTSIQNLIDVFQQCGCNIIYLKVIKSPLLIKHNFATKEKVDAFNEKIASYLQTRWDKSGAITIDEQLDPNMDYMWDAIHLKQSGYRKIEQILSSKLDWSGGQVKVLPVFLSS